MASNTRRRVFQDATTMGGAYHLICPDSSLCFELRTVANLQGTRAAPGKEIRNLLPGEVFLLFQVN
jgi:hypothetical protein